MFTEYFSCLLIFLPVSPAPSAGAFTIRKDFSPELSERSGFAERVFRAASFLIVNGFTPASGPAFFAYFFGTTRNINIQHQIYLVLPGQTVGQGLGVKLPRECCEFTLVVCLVVCISTSSSLLPTNAIYKQYSELS